MGDGTWPRVRIPGGTAEKHLEDIRKEARAGGGAKADDISKAVDACLRCECFQPGPQRGKAPADDARHGMSVLLAHMHSAENRWEDCLAALQHGEAPDSAKRQK